MKKRKRTRLRSGVTLVELIITIAILGLLVAVVPNVVTKAIHFGILTQARREVQRQARDMMDLVHRHLRQAYKDRVTVDRLNATQPPWSRISFYTIDSTSHTFYQDGRRFYHQINNGSSRVVAEDVRVVMFTYPRTDDPTIISMSVTTEKFALGGKMKTLQMAVEQIRIMN